MAKIRHIGFCRVGKNEGCLCDKCGQYIRNIVTVGYADGITCRYGTECFDKLYHDGLNAYGQKLMRQTLKSVADHQEEYEKMKLGAACEDNVKRFQSDQYWNPEVWGSASFEEWQKWMLDEWFPKRFEEDQKKVDRFANVNFSR